MVPVAAESRSVNASAFVEESVTPEGIPELVNDSPIINPLMLPTRSVLEPDATESISMDLSIAVIVVPVVIPAPRIVSPTTKLNAVEASTPSVVDPDVAASSMVVVSTLIALIHVPDEKEAGLELVDPLTVLSKLPTS